MFSLAAKEGALPTTSYDEAPVIVEETKDPIVS